MGKCITDPAAFETATNPVEQIGSLLSKPKENVVPNGAKKRFHKYQVKLLAAKTMLYLLVIVIINI